MKFNEKLQKLRKENKMSQEQLADLLDVSRQAVSKWESGTTYPEMDKLLILCKIFKCTLDELTNDAVSDITVEEKEEKKKKNWLNIILEYLNKTIHMFNAMSFHSIVSMIIRMLLVFIFLSALCIPVYGLYLLGSGIFYTMGDGIGEMLSGIWLFLLVISYAVLSITIFFYTFKTQYLDNYNTIKNEQANINNNENGENENAKIQVVYRDSSTSSVFQLFGKLCTYMFKTIIFFVSIPFFIFFIFLFIALILMIYCLFNGITYIGFLLAIIFSILLVFAIIKFLMEVLFSRKTNLSNMFRLVIVSIAGIGIAIGVCLFEIADSNYENTLPKDVKEVSIHRNIAYQEGLFIGLYPENYAYSYTEYDDKISYVVDENLKDSVRVEVSYIEGFQNPEIYIENDNRIVVLSNERLGNIRNIILNDLRNKKFHNYELLYNTKVTIYGSTNILNLIKKNYEDKIKMREESELTVCKQEKEKLWNEINNNPSYENLKNEIEKKKVEIEELKVKNQEIEKELNHYKKTLQELIKQ